MAPLDIDTVLAWRGKTVRDRHGEKIGRFGDVYLDHETDLPAYAAVNTGLFGSKESFLRLDERCTRVMVMAEIDGGDPDAVTEHLSAALTGFKERMERR